MKMQGKLWQVNPDAQFWKNLKKTISWMCKDLCLGHDIARIARLMRDEGVACSDSLLYKWCNPNDINIPNLEQFLLLIKVTENCEPLRQIGEACGYIPVPRVDPLEAMQMLLEGLKREV